MEQALFKRIKHRDKYAFELLYRKYFEKMSAFSAKY